MVFSRIFGAFSSDMGIDLGTANTRVCVRGQGVVLDEPTVVAVKKGTDEVLLGGAAIGATAKEMLGRTPLSIDVIRPLKDGVIADFDMTEALLTYFIRRVHHRRHWISPRIIVNVPTGVTAVEKRAVFNAAERAGARKVYLVDEPRAAGLGAGLPIHEARATMIVDIGGGTTDIAILSLADVVISSSIRVAGDAMDDAVSQYIRRNYNILVGVNSAEEIKIRLGSASPRAEAEIPSEGVIEVKGRDLLAGVPRAVTITAAEVREALAEPVRKITDLIHETLEKTGPELSGDLLERGMTLCGGGVLLRGLDQLIHEQTGLPVRVADDPMGTVVRGTAVFLDHLDEFKSILESAEDDL
ncbi:MAG: rod shape-determining protein [Planctomycetes bacterium]|nr:rod shape-determining protein [Planctomycetota bacterium]